MKRGDLTVPATLLALSGAALVAGPRVPRAPFWNAVAAAAAPAAAAEPMAAAVARGGPADPAWALAVLRYEWFARALAAVQDEGLREVLRVGATAATPVRALAGRLFAAPAGHVAGAPVALHPAVPGRAAGVRAGAGVAVGPVLVGVVAETEPSLCYVRLLTDPDCHVAVALVPPPNGGTPARARPTGPFVAEGRAGSRLLRVQHVPATAEVRVGDLVVTSGACGLLPAGLRVGTVVGVENPDAGPMLAVEVEPDLPAETPEAVAILLMGAWR